MKIQHYFDAATYTLTYLVSEGHDAVLIDPVWDFDLQEVKLSTESIDKVLHDIDAQDLHLHYVLETHVHADHLTASEIVKARLPSVQVAICERITEVQQTFAELLDADWKIDGSQFDLLLTDGHIIEAGALQIKALSTPGHTPACMSYVIGDAVFTGDAMFMPDYGVGRCDFPGGNAKALYRSIMEKIYTLPDHFMVHTGHDYQPNGRELQFAASVGQQKTENTQLKATTSAEDFVKFRTERDATLRSPKLLYPSLQINAAAGHLPPPAANGTHYLKLPVHLH